MNKILCNITCVIILCAILHGCGGSLSKFQVSINSWEGAPIEELVASWGEPKRIFKTSLYGTEYYYYVYNNPLNESSQRIEAQGSTHYQTNCYTTITVRPNGTINAEKSNFSKGEDVEFTLANNDYGVIKSLGVLLGGAHKNPTCLGLAPWPSRHIPQFSPE